MKKEEAQVSQRPTPDGPRPIVAFTCLSFGGGWPGAEARLLRTRVSPEITAGSKRTAAVSGRVLRFKRLLRDRQTHILRSGGKGRTSVDRRVDGMREQYSFKSGHFEILGRCCS